MQRIIDDTPTLRAFRADLRRLERAISESLEQQSACCTVSAAHCHLMLELDGGACVNQTTLASRLGMDKSTLSRTVDAMVTAGLLLRSTDPDNRRSQIICLSDEGKRKAEEINEQCDRYYRSLFKRIDPERQAEVIAAVQVLAQTMGTTNQELPHGRCCR